MHYFYNKAIESDGKIVREVKVLDYSGRCERPFQLPLHRRFLWNTAKYADVSGEFPDTEEALRATVIKNGQLSGEALLIQNAIERVRLSCGKCAWCAEQRKNRWMRAATGWVETSPLTVLLTLTFSDEYFLPRFNEKKDEDLLLTLQNVSHLPGFNVDEITALHNKRYPRADRFDPSDPEHDSFMRQRLRDERIKLFKRLRVSLERLPRFAGVELKAHLSVYEYGDLRGRLHLHVLLHFEVGDLPVGSAYARLRKFFKKHWHERGIGFVDAKLFTPQDGSEAARYVTSYLLAYEKEQTSRIKGKSRSRLAVSQGYRTQGTDYYYAARPSLIPGGTLRPADPIPLEEREGFPASRVDADLEFLELSPASKKLTFADIPHDMREDALEIAKARLAFNTGELWPWWSEGLHRPEDDWAEVPDDEWNFASWLLSRYWQKPVALPETPPLPVAPDVWPSGRRMGTGSPGISKSPIDWDKYPSTPSSAEPMPMGGGSGGAYPPVSIVPWGDGFIDEQTGEFFDADPETGEPVLPISYRAMVARGLGRDTLIRPDGTFRRKP